MVYLSASFILDIKMNIYKGNFNPIEIEKANKKFNVIIDNLKSNKIFNSFFSDLDTDTMIAIANLDERVAGETTRNFNGDRAIFFNSSIYDKMKEAFIKLSNKKRFERS